MLHSMTSGNTSANRAAVPLRATYFALALLAALLAVVLSAGVLAAPAHAAKADSNTQAAGYISAQLEDIQLLDLDGTTSTLYESYLGKKCIILVGRYGCLNTRSMVEQASYMLDATEYSEWNYLVFDIDNNAEAFQEFADYQADRLHFFTGMDYSDWAWDLWHKCGGTTGSVSLPFAFAVDETGNVFATNTGYMDMAEFISESTAEQGDDEELTVVSPNVTVHSQEEIIARMDKDDVMMGIEDTFATEPVYYSQMGELSDETKTLGLGMLNTIRYVAGLDDVTLDADYGSLAQAAAFADVAVGTISHYPARDGSKPDDMSDEVWEMGCSGASSSNLAMGYGNLSIAILYGWMSDSDESNVSAVGHRRWCLNPSMGSTGFGAAGHYHAMYSFDGSGSGTQTRVVWPAQNMPYELFDSYDPWSISVGRSITNPSDVTVTLTRKGDGKVWTFDKLGTSDTGCFYIDNSYIGLPGCIIFRPDGISYKAGDEFHVEATNVNGTIISYDVKFFEGFAGYHVPDDPDDPGTGEDLPAEVQEVVDLIYDLPTMYDLTLDDKARVEAAQAAYENLTDEQKAQVPEDVVDMLDNAVWMIAELEAEESGGTDLPEEVEEVVDLIYWIPDVDSLTIDDEYEVEKAQEAFENLTDEQKALVPATTRAKLEAAVARMAEIRAEIPKESIADYYSELDFTSAVYTGKRIKPYVYIDWLLEGIDYKVMYKNNVNIGTATAVATGIGDYEGTITLKFKIKPAKAVIKTAKAKKKAIALKLRALKGGVKYQVQYRTGKGKWKSKTVSKTSLTVKKLKSKKTYQVRVRAFKKVSGKTYYGAWSKTKKVKVK